MYVFIRDYNDLIFFSLRESLCWNWEKKNQGWLENYFSAHIKFLGRTVFLRQQSGSMDSAYILKIKSLFGVNNVFKLHEQG